MEKKTLETGASKMEQLVFRNYLPYTRNTSLEKYYVFLQTAVTQVSGW